VKIFIRELSLCFRMTAVGIQDVIVDAVSIVFIMDIDNMAREAIQT
jgi:hypothetical protein